MSKGDSCGQSNQDASRAFSLHVFGHPQLGEDPRVDPQVTGEILQETINKKDKKPLLGKKHLDKPTLDNQEKWADG